MVWWSVQNNFDDFSKGLTVKVDQPFVFYNIHSLGHILNFGDARFLVFRVFRRPVPESVIELNFAFHQFSSNGNPTKLIAHRKQRHESPAWKYHTVCEDGSNEFPGTHLPEDPVYEAIVSSPFP